MFLKPVPPSQSQHATVDTSDATRRLQSKLQKTRSLLDTAVVVDTNILIGSMYGLFTYIWLICMVNVGTFTIHGSGIQNNIYLAILLVAFLGWLIK